MTAITIFILARLTLRAVLFYDPGHTRLILIYLSLFILLPLVLFLTANPHRLTITN